MYTFEKPELNAAFERCRKEYEAYRETINVQVDYSNPLAIVEKLGMINNHNSSIPDLKSRFDWLLEKATAEQMMKVDHEAYPAKKYNAIIDSNVADINMFAKSIELLLKESHYQIESLRSALSYHKQEARM